MKIGISSLCLLRRSLDDIIKVMIEESSLWEVVDEGEHALDRERIRKLKETGLEFTVHGRFSDVNTATIMSDLRKAFLKIYKKSIKNAYLLDAKIWVLHAGIRSPLGFFYPELEKKKNLEFVRKLARYAYDLGVTIAVENVIEPGLIRKISEMEEFLSDIGLESVKACIDVGHFFIIEKDAFDKISTLRDEIVLFHLHDNDGINDSHLGIGKGRINWDKLLDLISEIHFRGNLILEMYSIEDARNSLKKLSKKRYKE